RVQVLRSLVVVIEAARAEADRLPRDIPDRPDQAPAEAVVNAALSLRDEAGREQLLAGEALRGEGRRHPLPALRRVTDAEVRSRAGVEAALAEEAAPCFGLRRGQLRTEELGRGGVGGEQSCAAAGL